MRKALAIWNATFRNSIQLREVARPSTEQAVVVRVSSRRSRCSTSRVGFSPKEPVNFISVGSHCNVKRDERTQPGSILHEIMHAVGVYHEQERRDRPSFLTISQSIESLARWGLACKRKTAECQKGQRGEPFGAYDFSSLMHYSFEGERGHHGQPTRHAKALLQRQGLSLSDVGQRAALSPGDIAGVRSLYGCNASYDGTGAPDKVAVRRSGVRAPHRSRP